MTSPSQYTATQGRALYTSITKLNNLGCGGSRAINPPTVISEDSDPRLEETLSGGAVERGDHHHDLSDNFVTNDPLMRIAQKLEHETYTPRKQQHQSLSPAREEQPIQIDDSLPAHYGKLFPITAHRGDISGSKGMGLPKDWCSAVDIETAIFI